MFENTDSEERETKLNLDNYRRFVKIYDGHGCLYQPDYRPIKYQFRCGQTVDGRILCRCLFEGLVLENDNYPNDRSLGDGAESYILGFSRNNKIFVKDVNHSRSAISWGATSSSNSIYLFSAREMLVESSNGVNPVELRFYLTNFEFQPIELNWQLDKHHVTIERIEDYYEILNIIGATSGIDITSKMSIKSLDSAEIFDITRVENLADDICRLLSLAKGNKVQWLYWEGIN